MEEAARIPLGSALQLELALRHRFLRLSERRCALGRRERALAAKGPRDLE